MAYENRQDHPPLHHGCFAMGFFSTSFREMKSISYVLDLFCFFLLTLGKEYRGKTFVASLNLALNSFTLPGWITSEQD
jgi:hypothetical protein